MVSFNKQNKNNTDEPTNKRTLEHIKTLIKNKTRSLVSSLFMLHVVNCKHKENMKKTSIITYIL